MSLEISSRAERKVKVALTKLKSNMRCHREEGSPPTSPGARGGRRLLSGLGHTEAQACQVWVEKPVAKHSLPSWIRPRTRRKATGTILGQLVKCEDGLWFGQRLSVHIKFGDFHHFVGVVYEDVFTVGKHALS